MVWFLTDSKELNAIKELETTSDRAAGIVAAAIVENRLKNEIQRRFHDHPKMHSDMFQSSGTLGSFKAKIDLGYLMGAYSLDAWNDLDNIRKIRNKFAHKIEIGSFGNDSVRSLCQNLKLVDRHFFEYGTSEESTPKLAIKVFEKDLSTRRTDPRQRYLLSAMFFVGAFTPIEQNPHRFRAKPHF